MKKGYESSLAGERKVNPIMKIICTSSSHEVNERETNEDREYSGDEFGKELT